MIEKIVHDGQLQALIIRAEYHSEGIQFLTPGDFSQQLGYMNRQKGYRIDPHVHKAVDRKVTLTQEVLIVRSGSVKVDFYNNEHSYLQSVIIKKGDIILLAAGGHGFEFLEDAEMVEVKQGPYAGDQDKVRFDPQ